MTSKPASPPLPPPSPLSTIKPGGPAPVLRGRDSMGAPIYSNMPNGPGSVAPPPDVPGPKK